MKIALIIWGIAGIFTMVYASWQLLIVNIMEIVFAPDKKDYIKPMLLLIIGIASVIASIYLYVR